MRRSIVLLVLLLATTLAAPHSALAHLFAEPAFLPVGSKQRLVLTVHNDRNEVMTGFRLTVPDGLQILGTGGADAWNEVVEGPTATWTGGSLAPYEPSSFEVDLEAFGVEPGAVELQGDQLYAGDETVRWPVVLTLVPPGEGPGEDDTVGGAAIVVLSVLGALVLAMFGIVLWQRRRRPTKLQER